MHATTSPGCTLQEMLCKICIMPVARQGLSGQALEPISEHDFTLSVNGREGQREQALEPRAEHDLP
jgi:hypothetical protein